MDNEVMKSELTKKKLQSFAKCAAYFRFPTDRIRFDITCNPCVCIMLNTSNIKINLHYKGKAVPLQVWSGPEGSRKLMFPDFMTAP